MSQEIEASIWWPLTLLFGSAPILLVLGVVGAQSLNKPEFEENRYRAWYLAEALKERGFEARVEEHPEIAGAAVDFHDPALEGVLIRTGAYIDAHKVVDYLRTVGRGSIAFRNNIMEGDIPIIALRPKEARGWIRRLIKPPPKLEISQVHVHTWNTVPSIHVHLKGRDLYLEDIERLADFISETRRMTRTFAVTP